MNYTSASAFRQALDDRLRNIARQEGLDLTRLQRRLAFERFLARVFSGLGDQLVLKGGYALELRLGGKARATVDLDFAAPLLDGRELLEDLQTAAEIDQNDCFRFVVVPATPPDLIGPPGGGFRFRIEAYLDRTRAFANFLLDVGMGDVQVNPTEYLEPSIDLGFAGLPAVRFPVTPLPKHFAEKLHAYTRPRSAQTRVKDLVDLVLMVEVLKLEAGPALGSAIEAVFNRYGTHPVPTSEGIEPPPETWQQPFRALMEELEMGSGNLEEAHQLLKQLLKRMKQEGSP